MEITGNPKKQIKSRLILILIGLASTCWFFMRVIPKPSRADESKEKYPITLKNEIADYLLQRASDEYWPDKLKYDPEADGSVLESLGVFEHWNNAADKKYSRDLGTGDGIELIYSDLEELANLARPN